MPVSRSQIANRYILPHYFWSKIYFVGKRQVWVWYSGRIFPSINHRMRPLGWLIQVYQIVLVGWIIVSNYSDCAFHKAVVWLGCINRRLSICDVRLVWNLKYHAWSNTDILAVILSYGQQFNSGEKKWMVRHLTTLVQWLYGEFTRVFYLKC